MMMCMQIANQHGTKKDEYVLFRRDWMDDLTEASTKQPSQNERGAKGIFALAWAWKLDIFQSYSSQFACRPINTAGYVWTSLKRKRHRQNFFPTIWRPKKSFGRSGPGSEGVRRWSCVRKKCVRGWSDAKMETQKNLPYLCCCCCCGKDARMHSAMWWSWSTPLTVIR